jgi:hypothetical protein
MIIPGKKKTEATDEAANLKLVPSYKEVYLFT